MVLAADVYDDGDCERFVLAGAVTGGVERVGGFGVGVGVQEPIEFGDGVLAGLAGLPGCGGDRDDGAGGFSAAEAGGGGGGVGFVQGDGVDEQADHAFTVALLGMWVGPECGEICCQGTDSVLQLAGEGGCGGG